MEPADRSHPEYQPAPPPLHPLTQILLVVSTAVIVFSLDVPTGLGVLGVAGIAGYLLPSRTDAHLERVIVRLLAVAVLFLVLIHCVQWGRPLFRVEGVPVVLSSLRRIGMPFITILYLSKRVTSEEMFALLTSLRMSPTIILILYRTLWLVPRMMERIDEVMLAQKLRGLRLDSAWSRTAAVLPTLNPIFASMLEETTDNSIVVTARGFTMHGRKSHLMPLVFRLRDWLLGTGCILVTGLVVLWV